MVRNGIKIWQQYIVVRYNCGLDSTAVRTFSKSTFFYHSWAALEDQGFLQEVPRRHPLRNTETPHLIGLLSTSDRLVTDTAT